ncbi:GNAT family N-acetyltransferase [Pseudonocardia sp. CA-107938]|uniref:GNAT family N-acetyltransferase n=1 Tax=Pseudonocardia sp. CA-107938 TaxID=3240021 RepID=UPI003D93B5F6
MDDVALWRLHVELEDRPGRLGELATAVGGAGCNIQSLHVVGEPADDGAVTDELLVKVPESVDPARVVAAVEHAGIPCTLLVRADAAELADPATTALALARMVAADPGSAPRAVATMLRAQLVDPTVEQPGHVHTLRVGTQHLRLARAWPFTATELSRAAALLELSAQLSLRAPARLSDAELVIALPDGSQVQLRSAEPADGPLVAALHARCSPTVRRARFLSPAPKLGADDLAELLGGATGQAVLAVTVDGGSAVGIATLSAPDAGVSRFGLLVEDAWQGRGLGTALLRRAAELAGAAGATELSGITRPDGVGVTRLLRRAGMRRPSAEMVGEEVHLHAQLAPVPVG